MLTIFKNGLRVCSSFIRVAPAMNFAGANKQVARTQAKNPESLARGLATELQFEKQRYHDFKEGEEFLKQTGFSQVETSDSVDIKLMKNVGDKVVEIRFQATEPTMDEDEEKSGEEKEEEHKEGKAGEEDQANLKSSVEFSVIVKNKDGAGVVIDCSSQETELAIFHVAYSKNVEEFLKGSMDKLSSSYLGPNFEQLDEKIQQSFVEYLESMGITDKLLAYIECIAVDKEQKMYMNWLTEVKEFVEPGKQ